MNRKLHPVMVRQESLNPVGRPWTVQVGYDHLGAFETEGDAEVFAQCVSDGMNAVLPRNGRCCGRKPLRYKRPIIHDVCLRCSVCYVDGEQAQNWAWRAGEDGKFRYAFRFAQDTERTSA